MSDLQGHYQVYTWNVHPRKELGMSLKPTWTLMNRLLQAYKNAVSRKFPDLEYECIKATLI